MHELEYLYKVNNESFEKSLIKNKLVETKNYFLISDDSQYYLENLLITGSHIIKLFDNNTLCYIIKYDQKLWQKLVKILLDLLRSEIIQTYIDIGFKMLV